MRFYNGNEDCAWLLDTALRGYEVPIFRSFVLHGNEDCPQTIELYTVANPNHDVPPIVRFDLVTGADDLPTYQRQG